MVNVALYTQKTTKAQGEKVFPVMDLFTQFLARIYRGSQKRERRIDYEIKYMVGFTGN